jgi:hypothetical protein
MPSSPIGSKTGLLARFWSNTKILSVVVSAVAMLVSLGLATPLNQSRPQIAAPVTEDFGELAGTAVVAVLNIRGRGLSLQESSLLADRVRTRLETSDQFRGVSAARIKATSDPYYGKIADCAEVNCAWRATELLQADYAVIGRMSGLGRDGEIELDLIDAGSGEVVEKFSEDVEGPLESPDNEWIPKLARRIEESIVERQIPGFRRKRIQIISRNPSPAPPIPGFDSEWEQMRALNEEFHEQKQLAVMSGIVGGASLVLGALPILGAAFFDGLTYGRESDGLYSDRRDEEIEFVVMGAGAALGGFAIFELCSASESKARLRNFEDRTRYRFSAAPIILPRGGGAVVSLEFR